MARSTDKTTAAGQVLERLRNLQESDTTSTFRAVASSIVELRKTYQHEGKPDWTGRSPEYREAIEALYRQAELPSDSEGSTQAKLRYHIGNVVRELAPENELLELGLKAKGPRDRGPEYRAHSRTPAAVRRTTADNPLVLAALAQDAIRLLDVVTIDAGDKPVVDKVVRAILDDCVSFLARG